MVAMIRVGFPIGISFSTSLNTLYPRTSTVFISTHLEQMNPPEKQHGGIVGPSRANTTQTAVAGEIRSGLAHAVDFGCEPPCRSGHTRMRSLRMLAVA